MGDWFQKLFFRGDEPKVAEIVCAGIGSSLVALYQLACRRPIYSQLYKYPMAWMAGYGVGVLLHDWNHKRLLFKEQSLWDFVEKHPEHFPEIKPKKYKDVLDVWHPIR